MQPEWEEALKAQRERVFGAVRMMNMLTVSEAASIDKGAGPSPVEVKSRRTAALTTALDNALRLARAIGAAEGGGHNPGCGCDAHLPARRQVEAIIRELGVE